MVTGVVTASYDIYVRDSSRNLLGVVDAFNKFGCTLRFNAVGAWILDVDADCPMAGYLATRGNGILVNRTIYNPMTGAVISSGVLFSGPIRGWKRQKTGNKLVVNGLDDLCWIAMRDAWPVVVASQAGSVITALTGCLRVYRLGEASGTTATDSKSAINGTYTATGVTYSVSPAIDSTNTAITLNGTNGRISIPTTSLPTGNSPWTLGAWVKLTNLPAANAYVLGYGAGTVGQNPLIYINTSGQPVATGFGFGDTFAPAMEVGVWHHLISTWDGTTLRLYVDSVQKSSSSPGAMTIPGTGLSGSIGSNNAGNGNWLPGSLDEVFISGSALAASEIQHLYLNSLSRFALAAYDARSGVAETIIRQYVDKNAITVVDDILQKSRVVSGLSLAADGAHGGAVTGNARFDAEVAKDGSGLLQFLALASGNNLGFKVTQSGTNLVFSVYVPADKTSSAKFSDDLGNLADFEYEVQAPDVDTGGNVVIVGGGGDGATRVFVERTDDQSIVDWGRCETFVDARDTSDPFTLQQRGDAALQSYSEQVSFSATLAPTQSLQYGVDFNLGDTVTVTIDGVPFQDIVREVTITLDNANAETVEPAIGTPNNASPKDALAALSDKLKAMQSQLAKLQRVK